jgi:hypothetical protein
LPSYSRVRKVAKERLGLTFAEAMVKWAAEANER